MSTIVIEDDEKNAPQGAYYWETEYWARCTECGWTGEMFRKAWKARQEGDQHVCPAPEATS